MKSKLKLYLSGIIIIFSFFLVCCEKQDNIVKIGWIGPLTGEPAYYGEQTKDGTDLAVEEINKQGGIKGTKIKVIYEDSQISTTKGVNAFTKLATIDKVPIIIQSAVSSIMLAEAPLAEKYKVVLISPTCSNPAIKNAGDYVFRIWPSDAYQGRVLAEYSIGEMKKSKAAILYINNDYGVGLKDEYVNTFQDLGGEIVLEEGFNEGITNFQTLLLKVKNNNPDIIALLSIYKESAIVLRQKKELGINVPVIGGDGNFAPELISLSNGAAEGMIVSNLYWDMKSEDPSVKEFVSWFQNTYKVDPEVYAASSYDCINVIAEAMKNRGEKADEIKKGLYNIRDFKGVTGNITIDQYGEAVDRKYNIYKVKENEFEKIK